MVTEKDFLADEGTATTPNNAETASLDSISDPGLATEITVTTPDAGFDCEIKDNHSDSSSDSDNPVGAATAKTMVAAVPAPLFGVKPGETWNLLHSGGNEYSPVTAHTTSTTSTKELPLAEPVTEPLAEPIAKPVTEPLVDSPDLLLVEPAADHLTEPAADHLTEPAPRQDEPAADPSLLFNDLTPPPLSYPTGKSTFGTSDGESHPRSAGTGFPPTLASQSSPLYAPGSANPEFAEFREPLPVHKWFFYLFLRAPIFLVAELISLIICAFYLIINLTNPRPVLHHYYLTYRQRLNAVRNGATVKQFYIWSYPGAPELFSAHSPGNAQAYGKNQAILQGTSREVQQMSILMFCLAAVAAFFYVPALLIWLQLLGAALSLGRYFFVLQLPLGEVLENAFMFLTAHFFLVVCTMIYIFIQRSLNRAKVQAAQAILDLHQSRREIVDAFEIERGRIERDLHDGAQQHLVNASMKVGEAVLTLQLETENPGPGETHTARLKQILELLQESQIATNKALEALRRTVSGVHPKVLSDHGLAAAIRDVCAGSPVVTDVKIPYPIPPLPDGLAAAAYFLVSECLTNILKYVPNPAASVLVVAGQDLIISIVDNGPGGAVIKSGGGLAGLQARLEAFGGNLTVSSPLGGPTTVRGQLPLIWDEKQAQECINLNQPH